MFENFDENRDFQNILTKIKISCNLNKIEIFENFGQVLTKSTISKNSTNIEIFLKKKSKVDFFLGISKRFEIFHKISEKSWFFVNSKTLHNFH